MHQPFLFDFIISYKQYFHSHTHNIILQRMRVQFNYVWKASFVNISPHQLSEVVCRKVEKYIATTVAFISQFSREKFALLQQTLILSTCPQEFVCAFAHIMASKKIVINALRSSGAAWPVWRLNCLVRNIFEQMRNCHWVTIILVIEYEKRKVNNLPTIFWYTNFELCQGLPGPKLQFLIQMIFAPLQHDRNRKKFESQLCFLLGFLLWIANCYFCLSIELPKGC